MKSLKKIKVSTLPNGYSLTYGESEFMYFNEVDLLAGFLARVGSGETKDMEKGSILNCLFDVMLGEKYAKDVERLTQTINRLESEYASRIEKLNSQISILNTAIERHDQLKSNINEITELAKKMNEGYKEAAQPYHEYNRRINDLEASLLKIESSFSASTTKAELLLDKIQRRSNDVDDTEKLLSSKAQMLIKKLEFRLGDKVNDTKTEIPEDEQPADEGDNQPGKSATTEKPEKKKKESKPTDTEEPKPKAKRGRNKAADALVAKVAEEQRMAEMEEKLKEHWEKNGCD